MNFQNHLSSYRQGRNHQPLTYWMMVTNDSVHIQGFHDEDLKYKDYYWCRISLRERL